MNDREQKQKIKQKIIEKMDRVLAEKFGDEFKDLKRDKPLQSAGLDSVDILDTIAILEKLTGVYFDSDELMDIESLDDLYELVFDKLAQAAQEDLHT